MFAIKWGGVKSEIIVRISKARVSKSSFMEDDKQKISLILFKYLGYSKTLK